MAKKINSVKVIIDGHEFDSTSEGQYYEYLKSREDVSDIILQPQYTLVERFKFECRRCVKGKVKSPKTGNLIKCKACSGEGYRNKQPWTYKADFKVIYNNGKVEIIDVKGWANERFPLVRKMFEYTQGFELLVVKSDKKGGWKYV